MKTLELWKKTPKPSSFPKMKLLLFHYLILLGDLIFKVQNQKYLTALCAVCFSRAGDHLADKTKRLSEISRPMRNVFVNLSFQTLTQHESFWKSFTPKHITHWEGKDIIIWWSFCWLHVHSLQEVLAKYSEREIIFLKQEEYMLLRQGAYACNSKNIDSFYMEIN